MRDVPLGHRMIQAGDLTGQALAWAVCSLYGVPAVIFDGAVHVEAEPGKWLPFDAEAMLRSLVVGHVPHALVPDEIA
jgi:hypothetical protein